MTTRGSTAGPDPFLLSRTVASALAEGRGVVALETSVLAQGLPPPRNREAAERMTAAVEAAGAVPAWVAVDGGRVHVGLGAAELDALARTAAEVKVARRDLPLVLAGGGPGATTVSATIWVAHRVGIRVAATGGIGGVHAGAGDVSADLRELAITPVLLVCSGPKSVVDPSATAERLDELGVAIVGYRCDRLPHFLVGEAPVELDHRVDDPEGAARLIHAAERVGSSSALLLCSPVPAAHAMDVHAVREAVRSCQERADREAIRGKEVTPFLLRCLGERTGGESVRANLALLEANAGLAGEIAAAVAQSRSISGARSSRSPW